MKKKWRYAKCYFKSIHALKHKLLHVLCFSYSIYSKIYGNKNFHAPLKEEYQHRDEITYVSFKLKPYTETSMDICTHRRKKTAHETLLNYVYSACINIHQNFIRGACANCSGCGTYA